MNAYNNPWQDLYEIERAAMSRAQLDAYHKRIAGRELEMVLAWVEHWQRDIAAGLSPTTSSLERVAGNIRHTLKEIDQ